jgi:isopenicillin N synthase-like dioxygenase
MSATLHSGIPLIDLSKPDSKHLIVKAYEEFGFFKVINHGVPLEFITDLESQAATFSCSSSTKPMLSFFFFFFFLSQANRSAPVQRNLLQERQGRIPSFHNQLMLQFPKIQASLEHMPLFSKMQSFFTLNFRCVKGMETLYYV